MSPRLRWRKFVSGFMLTMTGVCALVAVSVLFLILGYLVVHGGASINWNFFTKLPVPVGETCGGMANDILGSAKVLLVASLLGVPIGFFGAIYLAEFSGGVIPSSFAMPRTCSTACPPSSSAFLHSPWLFIPSSTSPRSPGVSLLA